MNTAFTVQSGALVLVHNRTDRPLTNYGVFAATGTFTAIGVSRTFFSRLSLPFNNCRKDFTITSDDSLYFQLTANYTKYSRHVCEDVYIQLNFYMESCSCMDPSLNYYEPMKTCTNVTSIICMLDVTQDLEKERVDIRWAIFILVYW